MAELVDALDLESSGNFRESSSLSSRIQNFVPELQYLQVFVNSFIIYVSGILEKQEK